VNAFVAPTPQGILRPPSTWTSRVGDGTTEVAAFSREVMMRTLRILGWTLLLVYSTTPARADERATALALLDQAIRVRGGDDRLAKAQIEARKATGTMTVFGKAVPFTTDMLWHLPGRQRAIIELNAEPK